MSDRFSIHNGRLYGSRGPIVADEMDLPILNVGSGDVPLRPQEHFLGPRGPVINVDYSPQPNLEQHGRQAQFPELTSPERPTVHLRHDATDVHTLRGLSQTGQFREIHAVNPYGFDPLTTAPLLAPTGSMHITGTRSNPYAHQGQADRYHRTRGWEPRPRMDLLTNRQVGLATVHETNPGTMHPDHPTTQRTSQGGVLDTSSSTTTTYRRSPTAIRVLRLRGG